MKKIIITLAGLLGLLVMTAVPAYAKIDLGIEKTKEAAGVAGYDAVGTTETTLAQNIGAVIRGILTISGVVFTALIFYAGYLWMTARGDEGNVEKAKNIIETSIVGLIIALASFGITSFVMKSIATKTIPVEVPKQP